METPEIIARLDTLIELMGGANMDVLVSCNEAARLLKKNPATISTMIRDGRLNKVTFGRSTGIRLSEIKTIINRREA